MLIKKIEVKEAPAFVKMLHQLDNETDMMMFEPGERKDTDDGMKSTLTRREENDSLTLGAFSNSAIVGYLVAERGYANRVKHTLYVHLGVLEGYHKRGIAGKMLEAMIVFAKEHDTKRIELTVRKDNIGAIRLYKRVGFEIEGIKRSSLFVKNDYLDEYYMSMIL